MKLTPTVLITFFTSILLTSFSVLAQSVLDDAEVLKKCFQHNKENISKSKERDEKRKRGKDEEKFGRDEEKEEGEDRE